MTGLTLALPDAPRLRSRHINRAGFSLFGSVLLHLVVLFSLHFIFVLEWSVPLKPTLRITIVNSHDDAPIEPEALAQLSQVGSGTKSMPRIPTSPFPFYRSTPLIQMANLTKPTNNVEPIESARWISTLDSGKIADDGGQAERMDAENANTTNQQATAVLVDIPFTGEVGVIHQQSSERERHTFITSSTRESEFALYMEGWRIKVEHIGTLNYPEVAKHLDVNGTVVLDVAIRRNGYLAATQLVKSSGNKRLDAAAIMIAHRAAPYDPLPEEIAHHTDILHITRTWEFQNDAKLITR